MILGSNVVVLQLAQYSVGFRAGRDRVSEIWTCEKTQARQHCFDSKRIVTKRSPATFGLLFVFWWCFSNMSFDYIFYCIHGFSLVWVQSNICQKVSLKFSKNMSLWWFSNRRVFTTFEPSWFFYRMCPDLLIMRSMIGSMIFHSAFNTIFQWNKVS